MLLDKEGAAQCRHSRENGKLVPSVEYCMRCLTVTIQYCTAVTKMLSHSAPLIT